MDATIKLTINPELLSEIFLDYNDLLVLLKFEIKNCNSTRNIAKRAKDSNAEIRYNI